MPKRAFDLIDRVLGRTLAWAITVLAGIASAIGAYLTWGAYQSGAYGAMGLCLALTLGALWTAIYVHRRKRRLSDYDLTDFEPGR